MFIFSNKGIPVLYIFGKDHIDINHCCESFRTIFPDQESKVLVIYEVMYNHAIGMLKVTLTQ